MVIDEAGAGMIVACTECGHDAPVPKPAAPPPATKPATGSTSDKERTVAMKWEPPPPKK
jgi:hypothetical protein